MATKEYRKQYYADNRNVFLLKNKAYQKLFDAIIILLKSKPCRDCGQSFPPCAMDFDHIIGEKVIDVCRLASFCSPARLVSEVRKCEIVCANCHRIRTEARRGKSRGMTIEEITDVIANRKKFYDRAAWIELFELMGASMPALPIPRKRGSRCVRKVGAEGTSWCRTERAFVSTERFEKNASRWNGLQGQCMDCRKKMPSRRSSRIIKQATLV